MRHVSLVLSLSLVTVAAACGKPSSGGESSSDKSKSAAIEPAKAGGGDKAPSGGDKATGGGSDGVAAPPADPLKDGADVLASCDQPKEDGACTEHYALGLGEDSAKQFCEGAMKGKWLKGKGCPKEGRLAVCRTDVDRMIYYKFDLSSAKDVGKLCTDTLMGKWAEFPKGK